MQRSLSGEERGHHPVAQALDDPSAVSQYRVLHRLADLTKELNRGGVAGLERPRGEPDQVCEQERHLDVYRSFLLSLREALAA